MLHSGPSEMPSDYGKIRKDNIKEYGEGTRHLADPTLTGRTLFSSFCRMRKILELQKSCSGFLMTGWR